MSTLIRLMPGSQRNRPATSTGAAAAGGSNRETTCPLGECAVPSAQEIENFKWTRFPPVQNDQEYKQQLILWQHNTFPALGEHYQLVQQDTGGGGDCLFSTLGAGWYYATKQRSTNKQGQTIPLETLRRMATNWVLEEYNRSKRPAPRSDGIVQVENRLMFAEALEQQIQTMIGNLARDVIDTINTDWQYDSKQINAALQKTEQEAASTKGSGSGTAQKFMSRLEALNDVLAIHGSPQGGIADQQFLSLINPWVQGQMDSAEDAKRSRLDESRTNLFRRAIAQYAFAAGKRCSAFGEDFLIEGLARVFGIVIVTVTIIEAISEFTGEPEMRLELRTSGDITPDSCYMYVFNPYGHFVLLGCLTNEDRKAGKKQPTVLFNKPLHLATAATPSFDIIRSGGGANPLVSDEGVLMMSEKQKEEATAGEVDITEFEDIDFLLPDNAAEPSVGNNDRLQTPRYQNPETRRRAMATFSAKLGTRSMLDEMGGKEMLQNIGKDPKMYGYSLFMV